MHRHVARLALVTVLAIGVAGAARAGGTSGFEVWAVDQSNTTGTTSGGTIHVYEGADLNGVVANGAAAERIGLGGAAMSLCLSQTGTAPVRPHMLLFNAGQTHAVLAFVASGHVVFFDAATRTPTACVDVGAQAHSAVPAPDESYVVVANQNGKLLQRITTDYDTNTFTLDPAATLDLANGMTPSGALRQDPSLRPDNAPICPLVDSTSRIAFVTLRGSGLFVVDSRSTPMRILAEYDRARLCTGTGAAASRRAARCTSTPGAAPPPTSRSSTCTRSCCRHSGLLLRRRTPRHRSSSSARTIVSPPTPTASRSRSTGAISGWPTVPATASS